MTTTVLPLKRFSDAPEIVELKELVDSLDIPALLERLTPSAIAVALGLPIADFGYSENSFLLAVI